MSLHFELFSDIPDPRQDINIQHDLMDILVLTVCAVVSGALGWHDIYSFGKHKLDWLRQYRPFKNGYPSEDTIARVVSSIKPEAFNQAFITWVNSIRQDLGQPQIAIDGKTLRGSHDGNRHNALHSITVWYKDQGLVLAQQRSAGKKNEQESVLDVLDSLQIKGTLISVDAMNSQKKIADKIIQLKADYVLCIKDNHKTLREEIIAYFHKIKRDSPDHILEYQEIDSGHGRIETRICRQLRVSEWITEANAWQGISTVLEIERVREYKRGGKVEKETQYYISSLSPDAEKAGRAVRSHWEVENKAHWVLDVTYGEDDCRIRKGDGAENVAIIRRIALNLARLHPDKTSLRQKLKGCGWSDDFRAELVFGRKLT